MSRITWTACPRCAGKFYFHTDDFASGKWNLRCPYCAHEFPPSAPSGVQPVMKRKTIACPHCARRFDSYDDSQLRCPFCAHEFRSNSV